MEKRLQNFPDAPELPILPESKCEKVTFTQYRHFITPENWSKLCEKARMQRLTPSGVVLSAYAEIIGRWSKRKDFCIDITILNRPSIHSQINEIVGDFTEVDILEISPEYPSDLLKGHAKFKISYGKILVTAHLPVLMYCGKLTGKVKRKLLFRLSTQAQWERLIPKSRKTGSL